MNIWEAVVVPFAGWAVREEVLRHFAKKDAHRLTGQLNRIERKINRLLKEDYMDITWKGCNQNNFNPGRNYYWSWSTISPWLVGKKAPLTTIVFHWMDGNLATTDGIFNDPKRQVSAHFGIEDGTVHQYVQIGDTSYSSGNGKVNCESIGIEHSAEPNRPASDQTYETSAQLVAFLAQTTGKKVTDFRSIGHNQVIATQCPGTLDIPRIIRRAQEIEASSTASVDQPIDRPAIQGMTVGFKVPVVQTFDVNLSPSMTYNPEVNRMQRFLTRLGYLRVPSGQEGYYGKLTQYAINSFQKDHGIKASSERDLKGNLKYFGWWYDKTREAANKMLFDDPARFA